MKNSSQFVAFVAFIFSLAGCGGGGGGDSDAPSDVAIFVNAGPDRDVVEQNTIALTGEARSSDESLTFSWSVTPPLTITHEDTTVAGASFTAPVTTEHTPYTFTLTVTGSQGGNGDDTVVINVLPENINPVAVITAPQIENINSGFLPAGQTMVLDGSNSIDADAPDPERQIVQWLWQQTAGVAVLESQPTDLPQLEFTTPILQQREDITLTLTVTDAEGATDTETFTATLLSDNETPPSVSAGLDQFVFGGEVIVLNGQVSTTVPDAEPLQVLWESTSTLNIDNSELADTFATAPNVDSATDMEVSLTVIDGFGNRVVDTFAVTVSPVPIPVLNDTGVVFQGTVDAVTTSQQNSFPGQDAQRGQDRMDLSGTLEKSGRGQAGFDFTPLNANGDEMDDLSEQWGCVRDNTTGLVWEVKTANGSLHDSASTYSWFQEENNGGFEGDANGTGTVCGLANCNTTAFISAVNGAGLCGFFDWRLPTHDELMSIVDFGSVPGPKIDSTYFPLVGGTADDPVWYWTNQPGADGVLEDAGAQNAWALDFNSGVDNFLNKSTPVRIRLVRAGR